MFTSGDTVQSVNFLVWLVLVKFPLKHYVSTDEHAQLFCTNNSTYCYTLVLALIALKGQWQYVGHQKITTEFYNLLLGPYTT